MKYADVEKMRGAGLISDEQSRKIIEQFGLKEEGGKFLAIISIVGSVLVVSGIILLISANWEEIPRVLKIGVGLSLMLGAHGGGWWLREVHQKYPKSGEALHLIGSGLFLGNIALIGQVYHLSARAPNAILLWWLGIAALPWLLRSKAQHVLLLLAFGGWFGLELNERDSFIYFRQDEYQLLPYATLGLIYLGAGYCLRRTPCADFASATEKLGLLAFQLFSFPLTWGDFWRHSESEKTAGWLFPALAGVALLVIAPGVGGLQTMPRQWRWTWTLTLTGAIGLLAGALYLPPLWGADDFDHHNFGYHWIAAIAL